MDKLQQYFNGLQPEQGLKRRVESRLDKPPVKKKRHIAGIVTAALCTGLVLFFVLAGAVTVRVDAGNERVLRFSTRKEVGSYVEKAVRADSRLFYAGFPSVGCGSKMPDSNISPSPDASSDTNTQVAGVDEADIVKNDGRYLYRLVEDQEIRITDTQSEAAVSIPLEGRVQELYVAEDVVVALGNSDVYFYKADGRQIRSLGIEAAHYVSSRRIGAMLYSVYQTNGVRWQGDTLLPSYVDSAAGGRVEVPAENILAIPNGGGRTVYTYVVALRIPDGEVDFKAYIGTASTVYCSRNALYTASVRYPYTTNLLKGTKRNASEAVTVINRYAFAEEGTELAATGSVRGTLINQFAMDEAEDTLRVAASITNGGGWVYVLDFAKERMEIRGAVGGMGAERGERIYSVRFLEDYCYLVTARNTDPLFAVDLSDADNPEILGELHMPGVSDYLHPYDENTMFGIGRNGEENGGWFYGVKLSLFDVSDKTHPVEKQKLELADDISSGVTANHKELLYYETQGRTVFGFSCIDDYNGTRFYTLFEIDGESIARIPLDYTLPQGSRRYLRGMIVAGRLYLVSETEIAEFTVEWGEEISVQPTGKIFL